MKVIDKFMLPNLIHSNCFVKLVYSYIDRYNAHNIVENYNCLEFNVSQILNAPCPLKFQIIFI